MCFLLLNLMFLLCACMYLVIMYVFRVISIIIIIYLLFLFFYLLFIIYYYYNINIIVILLLLLLKKLIIIIIIIIIYKEKGRDKLDSSYIVNVCLCYRRYLLCYVLDGLIGKRKRNSNTQKIIILILTLSINPFLLH